MCFDRRGIEKVRREGEKEPGRQGAYFSCCRAMVFSILDIVTCTRMGEASVVRLTFARIPGAVAVVAIGGTTSLSRDPCTVRS